MNALEITAKILYDNGLRTEPCLIKAYRNFIQKFERTESVTDKLNLEPPTIHHLPELVTC